MKSGFLVLVPSLNKVVNVTKITVFDVICTDLCN